MGVAIQKVKSSRWPQLLFPVVILLGMTVLFGILTGGTFLSGNNLKGVIDQALIVAVASTGAAFIYGTGSLDVSLGAATALAATLGGKAYEMTGSLSLMMAVCLLSGIVFMGINAVLGTKLRIIMVVMSVVMMQIYAAVQLEILGAKDIQIPYKLTQTLENANFRLIALIIYFIVCFVLFHLTQMGRSIRFIGGNPECARQTGISRDKWVIAGFLLAGAGLGLAALFYIVRSGSVGATTAASLSMDTMLTTVLGGMAINGGHTSKSYAGLIGALSVCVLNKGLLMLGVSVMVVQGIRGGLFLLLVYWNLERSDLLP